MTSLCGDSLEPGLSLPLTHLVPIACIAGGHGTSPPIVYAPVSGVNLGQERRTITPPPYLASNRRFAGLIRPSQLGMDYALDG